MPLEFPLHVSVGVQVYQQAATLIVDGSLTAKIHKFRRVVTFSSLEKIDAR